MLVELNCIAYIMGLIICVFCNINGVQHAKSCNPAEEFKDYQFSFLYRENNFKEEIQIWAGNKIIGKCSIFNQTCHTFSTDYVNLSIHEIHENRILTLTRRNISRNDQSDGPLFCTSFLNPFKIESRLECKPLVFSKARGFSCAVNISQIGFIVTCSTQRIYPEGRCNFYINNALQKVNIQSNNEALTETPKYFTSVCTLWLPNSSLSPGMYDVNVTMYPNVTNNDTDVQYGTSYNVFITFEKPSVKLVNCSSDVKETNKANCTCKGSHDNFTNGHIVLFYLTGTEIQRFPSVNVKVDSKLLETGFICRATNIFGWESDPVFYKANADYGSNKMILISSLASGGVLLTIITIVLSCILKKKVWSWTTVSFNQTLTVGQLDNRASYECQDIFYEAMD